MSLPRPAAGGESCKQDSSDCFYTQFRAGEIARYAAQGSQGSRGV